MSNCNCDWSTGECQAPLGCKAIAEIEKLRNQLEKARRVASDLSDFWGAQAGKNNARHDHYTVLSSQFRRVANELSQTDETSKPTGKMPGWYCPACDLKYELHEDSQGFHHIIKGERVACPSAIREGE